MTDSNRHDALARRLPFCFYLFSIEDPVDSDLYSNTKNIDTPLHNIITSLQLAALVSQFNAINFN